MSPRWAGIVLTVVVVVPNAGSAQTVAGAARVPSTTVRRLPTAPQSGARPTETRVPPPAENRDLFLATRETYARRYDRPPRHFHQQPWVPRGFGYGYVQDVYVPPSTASAPLRQEGLTETTGVGFLRLVVEPLSAQVYVNGYFVGTVAEFDGRLEPGFHSVELKAPGFQSVAVDVRISVNETVSYRTTLVRSGGTPEPPRPLSVQRGPQTLYVIPRCYAGDTAPTAAQLPAGCEIANLRRVR